MKKFNLPSFTDVLRFLDDIWKNDQAKISKQTDGLITYLKNSAQREPSGELDSLGFHGEDKARQLYGDQYDTLHHVGCRA